MGSFEDNIKKNEEFRAVNHKGGNCLYKPVTCQEGWCSDCFIYQTYLTIQEGCGILNKKGKTDATIRGNNKQNPNKQNR